MSGCPHINSKCLLQPYTHKKSNTAVASQWDIIKFALLFLSDFSVCLKILTKLGKKERTSSSFGQESRPLLRDKDSASLWLLIPVFSKEQLVQAPSTEAPQQGSEWSRDCEVNPTQTGSQPQDFQFQNIPEVYLKPVFWTFISNRIKKIKIKRQIVERARKHLWSHSEGVDLVVDYPCRQDWSALLGSGDTSDQPEQLHGLRWQWWMNWWGQTRPDIVLYVRESQVSNNTAQRHHFIN